MWIGPGVAKIRGPGAAEGVLLQMPFGMAPVWDRMSPLRPGAAVRSGDGFFAQLWAGKGEVLAQMWERTSLS